MPARMTAQSVSIALLFAPFAAASPLAVNLARNALMSSTSFFMEFRDPPATAPAAAATAAPRFWRSRDTPSSSLSHLSSWAVSDLAFSLKWVLMMSAKGGGGSCRLPRIYAESHMSIMEGSISDVVKTYRGMNEHSADVGRV